ncbi:hypothetical protein HD806DRAFT_528289 [Xylariaceae sp. AK1471]|nr:hypothetical protein HD806DRAFT_528289 [Xylariaceae sp. AK1471]
MEGRFKRLCYTPIATHSPEIVTIENPGGGRYTVHAIPLAHHSRYFRQALNSSFVEGKTCTIRLDKHVDDEVLDIFTHWLYVRSVPHVTARIANDCEYGICIKGWIFGDHIQAPSFQNDIMRCLLLYETYLYDCTITCMETQWEIIPTGSALETLHLDLVCLYLLNPVPDDSRNGLNGLPLRIIHKAFNLIWQRLRELTMDGGNPFTNEDDKVDWKIGDINKYRVEEEDDH